MHAEKSDKKQAKKVEVKILHTVTVETHRVHADSKHDMAVCHREPKFGHSEKNWLPIGSARKVWKEDFVTTYFWSQT